MLYYLYIIQYKLTNITNPCVTFPHAAQRTVAFNFLSTMGLDQTAWLGNLVLHHVMIGPWRSLLPVLLPVLYFAGVPEQNVFREPVHMRSGYAPQGGNTNFKCVLKGKRCASKVTTRVLGVRFEMSGVPLRLNHKRWCCKMWRISTMCRYLNTGPYVVPYAGPRWHASQHSVGWDVIMTTSRSCCKYSRPGGSSDYCMLTPCCIGLLATKSWESACLQTHARPCKPKLHMARSCTAAVWQGPS
eukprot:1137379-Pelagomonas_calceolata.AAC.8